MREAAGLPPNSLVFKPWTTSDDDVETFSKDLAFDPDIESP
jgi:hypothetical protein